MKRKCKKCGRESVGLFLKKKRCYFCGSITEKIICRKLPDVKGFIPKEDIYGC